MAVKARQPGAAASGSSYPSAPTPSAGSRRKAARHVTTGKKSPRALTPCCAGASIMKRAGAASVTFSGTTRDPTRAGHRQNASDFGFACACPSLPAARSSAPTSDAFDCGAAHARTIVTCSKRALPRASAPRRRRPQNKEAASPPTMFLRGSPTKRRHRGLRETGRSLYRPCFSRPRPPVPPSGLAVLSEIAGWRRLVGLRSDRRRGAIALRSKHFS